MRIAVCCAADEKTKYLTQAVRWAQSMRWFGPPCDLFVGLNLPKYAFDMLPIAALIGSLLALGNLARSMELIVVRAAGVSVAQGATSATFAIATIAVTASTPVKITASAGV